MTREFRYFTFPSLIEKTKYIINAPKRKKEFGKTVEKVVVIVGNLK